MKWFLLIILATPAYAAGTVGTISATIVDPVSIYLNADGSVTVSGITPLYCDATSTEVTCYY